MHAELQQSCKPMQVQEQCDVKNKEWDKRQATRADEMEASESAAEVFGLVEWYCSGFLKTYSGLLALARVTQRFHAQNTRIRC